MELIEKDYPAFDLISKDKLAYLMNRDLGHSNMHKVQREAYVNVLKYLFEANLIMMNLDTKYQAKVVHNSYFHNYMRMIMDIQPKEDEQNDIDNTLAMWSNFVRIGLEGLRRNMPNEFSNVIDNMMNPISDLLEGISRYSVRLGSERFKNFENEWGYVNIPKNALI